MFNPHTKFEVSAITCNEEMKWFFFGGGVNMVGVNISNISNV